MLRVFGGAKRPVSGLAVLQRASMAKRFMSDERMSDYEEKIYKILTKEFEPAVLDVRDVSGGCGSMFAITVVSDKFNGLPMIKQHKLVNKTLADEIAKWHGLQLNTKPTNK